MASCSIERRDNKIQAVRTRNGLESTLFGRLASIPLIRDTERALGIYSSIYSDKFKSEFGNWEKRLALNPKAVTSIKNKLKAAGIENRALILKANDMVNPKLVKVDNTGLDIEGRSSYSEDIEAGDEVMLYDELINSEISVGEEDVPVGSSVDEVRKSKIESDLNPVVTLEKDGKTYKFIKSNYSMIDGSQEIDLSTGLTYENGEPRLFFMTAEGVAYEDYAEALRNTKSGSISIGFLKGSIQENEVGDDNTIADISVVDGVYNVNNTQSFIEVGTLNANSTTKTLDGFINSLIRRGYLGGQMRKGDDRYYLVGEGRGLGKQKYNSSLAASEAKSYPGVDVVSYDDGRLEISIRDTKHITLVSSNGESQTFTKDQIKEMLDEGRIDELRQQYEDIDVVAFVLFGEDNAMYNSDSSNIIADLEAEQTSQKASMLSILRSLGVSVIGMDEYLTKYRDKNGVDPSVKALADMSEHIVALAEGSGVNELTEETAHFLIETYENQDEINGILDQVTSTEEWSRYSDTYYKLYGQKYEGQELDQAVKREILGKILTNEFNNRFERTAEEANNEQSSGFFASLSEIFRKAVEWIRSRFSTQRQDLDSLVSKIADMSLAEDPSVFNTNNIKHPNFTLYSATDKEVYGALGKYRDQLRIQLRNIQQTNPALSAKLKPEFDRLNESVKKIAADMANEKMGKLDDNMVRTSIFSIVATAEAQTNLLQRMVRIFRSSVNKGGESAFDYTAQQNLDNVNNIMKPLLQEMRGFISVELDVNESFKKQMLAKIDGLNSRIDALNSDATALMNVQNQTNIDRMMDRWNIGEEEQKFLKDRMNGVVSDMWKITRWFGTLEHSGNPILQMLGQLISISRQKAKTNNQIHMRDVIKFADDKGFNIKKYEKLIQQYQGQSSNYLRSKINWAKFETEFKRQQLRAVIEATPELQGQDFETLWKKSRSSEGLTINGVKFKPDLHKYNLSFLDDAGVDKYNNSMNEWLEKNTEKRYAPEYYKIVEGIYEDAAANRPEGYTSETAGQPIRKSSRSYLGSLTAQKYAIKKRFMDSNGVVDWKRMFESPTAREELKDIEISRKLAKSLYDPNTGEKKTGAELALAEDIHAIDGAWRRWNEKHPTTRSVTEDFFKQFEAAYNRGGEQGAFEFIKNNTRISFNQKFWDELGESFEQRVRNYLDIREDADGNTLVGSIVESVQNDLDDYIDAVSKRKAILRAYMGNNVPGEVDYDSMTEESKQNVKRLTSIIQDKSANIYTALRIPYGSSIETEYETNNAFRGAYYDSNIEIPSEFSKLHTTDRGRRNIEMFKANMDAFYNGDNVRFSGSETAFLKKNFPELKSLEGLEFAAGLRNSINEIDARKQTLVDHYAETQLLPYFKRFGPAGYDNWIGSASLGEEGFYKQVTEMIRGTRQETGGVEDYIQIEPIGGWQEESSEFDKYINPNYENTNRYGRYQPKMVDEKGQSLYRDDDFYSYFGISKSDKQLRPTKNQDELEMINRFVAIKEQALGKDGYDELTYARNNVYEIPQISKTGLEKLYSSKDHPIQTLKNAFRDAIGIRVDELEYGQSEDLSTAGKEGSKYKVIPKFYLRRLEEDSDVAHDLLRSYAELDFQANLYRERMNTIGDVMGLQQKLLNTKYEKDQNPQATNSYQMFKEWVEAHYYGVQFNAKKLEYTIPGTSYKFDVSKIARGFDAFVRTMNLGFSPAVAFTGMVTGQVNTLIEGAVGQYVHLGSLRYADKEILKLSSGFVGEIGKNYRENRLYVLGERMGIFNVLERTRSAGFNRAIRPLATGLPYKMLEILNEPLAPKVMISIMDDTRLYKGKFYRYNDFKAKFGKGRSSSSIKSEWDKLQGDSLYNILEVKDGQVVVRKGVDENLVQRQILQTQRAIRSLNNICDGVLSDEDRVSASRNWMLNFTMAHRGWFILSANRLYKDRQYNFATGQMEIGHLRSLANFVKGYMNLLKSDTQANIFNAFKKEYAGLPEYERRNLVRLMLDVGVYAVGAVAMNIFAAMADDDDNKDSWLIQFTAYIALRTINEIYSQSPGMFEWNAVDITHRPFVVADKLQELLTFSNWSLDEVQSGVYKGESKLYRLLMRQTFGKQWYTMNTAENVKYTSDSWRFYNSQTMIWAQKKRREINKW